MRRTMVILSLLLLPAGCGDQGPPDPAASERLIVEAVLDHHRARAERDAEAACDGLTEEAQAEIVEFEAGTPRSSGDPPDDCVEAIERLPTSERLSEIFLNTEVHAVRVAGERATATASTAVPDGRRTPPVDLQLRWSDGRWLID